MNSADRFLNILKTPYITEKTSRPRQKYKQYAFKVLMDATKIEIRQAIEKLLGLKVRSVQVCRIKGTLTRRGQIQGRTKAWKKAYVVLSEDQEIDLTKLSS